MHPEELVPIVSHLRFGDAAALKLASASLGQAVLQAQKLWAAQAMLHARLVTVAHTSGGRSVVVVTPHQNHYVVRHANSALQVSRRMLVHEFPKVCMLGLKNTDTLWRVESCLAFEPHISQTLPLGLVGLPDLPGLPGLPGLPELETWAETRLGTNVTLPGPLQLYPEAEWPSVFQRHARFFVGMRTDAPRRQRGRRARRWTKVDARRQSR